MVAHDLKALQSECFEEDELPLLARAEPHNLAEVDRFLDSTGPLQHNDLEKAFDDAIAIIENTRGRGGGSGCDANVFILTDRDVIEGDVVDALTKSLANVDALHLHPVYLGANAESTALKDLNCITTGVGTTGDLKSVVDFWAGAMRNAVPQVFWSTNPYEDANGSGLVATGAINCYDEEGTFIGVAGIDISLSEFATLVDAIKFGDTYGAVINTYGDAILHPKLSDDVVSRDISSLENYEVFKSTIRPLIHGTQYGQQTVTVDKVYAIGDFATEGFRYVGDRRAPLFTHVCAPLTHHTSGLSRRS